MYLEHFNLKELPFTLTPNVNMFCNHATHQEALNTLLVGLRNGEGFIKITGEVGMGKTLLCRKLLESLGNEFVTAYILNPDLTPGGLRRAFAKELGIEKYWMLDQHALLEMINYCLLKHYQQGKQVVLVLDEAQALSAECLDALRLLTNLETEKAKLLQIVLFGQPELDERLKQKNMRQLKQRISFSYKLRPLNQDELSSYLTHRLAMAGYTKGPLFTPRAFRKLYKASRGLPRIANILSHKALLAAYGRGEEKVSKKAVRLAINDGATQIDHRLFAKLLLLSGILIGSVLIIASYNWFT